MIPGITGRRVLHLLDPPDILRRKVARAVTETDARVWYDPKPKPGVSNLLAVLSALTSGGDPAEMADRFGPYASLKATVADVIDAVLLPKG